MNALILMNCDEGEFQLNRSRNEEIAKVLNISMKKIDRVKRRFVEEGFEVALGGHKSERVYEKKADGDFEAHLVALSCGEPPKGHCRWSLRLLAGQCLRRRIDNISKVRKEVEAWQHQRNNMNAKINWQFTADKARIKLKRLYPTLYA